MKRYNVVLVGIGLVGTRILQVLRERKFPVESIKILARSSRTETIDGVDYKVVAASPDEFEGADLALFAGTEGAKGASLQYGWEAVKRGCVVVDNGDDFRMDDRVPLVVPEVNPEAMRQHQGIIANPNCSTIQMVAALAPLHRAVGIKRVVVTTFQAVSGTGGAAVTELERQVRDVPEGKPANPEQYPHQIFANVIPQISTLKDIFPGYYGEEIKMIRETRKILSAPDIAVSASCVRVPVYFAHSETLNVELKKKLTAAEAREILSKAEGIKVIDDPAKSKYPTPLDVAGHDEVFVGRIREDSCNPNTLDLWCVADNIRKGAATNAIQIAEKLVEMDLLKVK